MPSRRSPIPYISATIVRAWRSGSGHLEHLQRRRGDAFVGLEAAQRSLAQGRVAGGLQVQLDLGQLLDPVARLLDDPLDLGRHLLDARLAPAQLGGDLLLARHLLADEEQQALAQQIDLAGEVVGERAEGDAGGAGDAAVGDGAATPSPPISSTVARRMRSRVSEGATVAKKRQPTLFAYRSFERTTAASESDGEAPGMRDDDDSSTGDRAGCRSRCCCCRPARRSSRELVEAALERAEATPGRR